MKPLPPRSYSDIADAMPHLVWTADADGHINYINARCHEYTGSKEGIDGIRHWLEALHPDDAGSSIKKWTDAIRGGTPFQCEYRLRRHDGVYHWFLGRAVPIKEDDRIHRWIGTATDIESQKCLLNDLQQSRTQSQILLEGITDGVLMFNRDGQFIYVNRAGAEMCGFNSGEEMMLSQSDQLVRRYEILDEDGNLFPLENLPARRALKGVRSPSDVIVQFVIKATGQRRWSLVSAVPIFDANGEVAYAVSIFRDFTIHKENETALRNSENSFRLIAETGIILSSSLDYSVTLQKLSHLIVSEMADGCIIDLMGVQKDPIVVIQHKDQSQQKALVAYRKKYPPENNPAQRGVPNVIKTGKSEFHHFTQASWNQLTANEEQQKVVAELGIHSAMIVPIISSNSKVHGTLSFINSEPQRKFSSVDLAVAEDLGRRVGISIAKALLYESECRAREQAEAANNLKSTFLANMSHEIRTPLNALIGFNELLRSDSLSTETRHEYHNIIKRNGELLLGLIDDILDLTKVEAGHIQLEIASVKLADLLEEVSAFMKIKASGKKLKFILETVGELPERIQTDQIRLKQILNNIIGNAIKFTTMGHVKTTLSMDRDRNMMIFTVSDTGIGIRPEVRDKLFQPFSQADASVTRRYGGTGLGLALSKKLAEELGGNLYLQESGEGEGAVFTIEVSNNLKLTPKAETQLPNQDRCLKGRRILVVDDSHDNQFLLQQILKRHGVYVDLAENGEVGVDKALNENYDIVLMDVQMPVLDGHSATKKLRSKNYVAPIIALTAHAMLDDRNKCIEVGCTDYLTKPIRADQLIQMICQHVK
ncbi:MAG: response regulator [Pseudobdellovibrio sp.]